MVLLEAFGLASAELFNYNRENFQFDNEQRIHRDVQKIKMQIERFELFREDIDDLVKLTVQKMDMYHLVAAVVLGFTTSIFTEGRIWAESPPSYIALYFMTIGCGWIYLLLTVWLSMYASISSHSLGVRLRTRYIRLPIPNLQQLFGIASKLQDFEKQGADKMFRLPFGFQGTPEWRRPTQGTGAGSSTDAVPDPAPAAGNFRRYDSMASQGSEDLLGMGEAAFGREEVLTAAASNAPGQHVHMFRKLQAKWQCFDAYARVSMSLGVHQIIQALNLFVLGLTLVESQTPTTSMAITLVFQTVAFALIFMDLAGLRPWQWVCMALVTSAPCMITIFSLASAPRKAGKLDIGVAYPAAPLTFFCQALYSQIVLFLARPSDSAMSLPRRFRAVLFLDVFGDACYDPTDAEQTIPPEATENGNMPKQGERLGQGFSLASCESASMTAQMALRRWEALPEEHLSSEESQTLWQLRKQYTIWRKVLMNHISEVKAARGVGFDIEPRDALELRPWADLAEVEKAEDEFTDALIGPLESVGNHGRKVYYYDLEAGECIWDRPGRRSVLRLQEVAGHVKNCELAVKELLASDSFTPDDEGGGGSAREVAEQKRSDGEGVSLRRSLNRRMTAVFGKTKVPQVDSLPWKVLQRMTQVIQLCWFFLGFVEAMANWWPETFGTDVFTKNNSIEGEEAEEGGETHETHEAASEGAETHAEASEGGGDVSAHTESSEGHGERRLRSGKKQQGTQEWWQSFKEVRATWPHGMFFQAVALSCLTAGGFPDSAASLGSRLLVTSPFAMYRSLAEQPGSLRWQAVPRANFASGATAVCGLVEEVQADADSVCMMVAPIRRNDGHGGLAFWRLGSKFKGAVELSLGTGQRPWELLSGATLRCDQLSGLLGHNARQVSGGFCLLLAGWDGERLPVAVVPLPRGPGEPPEPSRNVSVRFDVPLTPSNAACKARPAEVQSLHVEPETGKLWVLFSNGELLAWDLPAGEALGSWQPSWPKGTAFQAAALCEATPRGPGEPGQLLVAGTASEGGNFRRPALLEVQLPQDLRSKDMASDIAAAS